MTNQVLEVQHERLQGHLIYSVALLLIGLVGQEVVESIASNGVWQFVLSIISLVGGAWFTVALLRMRKLGTVTEEGDFYKGIFDDERVRNIRAQAFSFALMAVLVLQCIMLVGNGLLQNLTDFSISTELAINLTIAVAVIGSLARFKYLNRDA